MFDERYADNIFMFNNSRDAIGIALKYLGYSYNTTDPAQITEAVDLLIQQKPLVNSYGMDDIFEKMQSGAVAIGAYYYGDFLTMQEVNPDLAFCLPEEGTNPLRGRHVHPQERREQGKRRGLYQLYVLHLPRGLKNCEEIWYFPPPCSPSGRSWTPEVAADPYAYPDEVHPGPVRELQEPARGHPRPVRLRVDPALMLASN